MNTPSFTRLAAAASTMAPAALTSIGLATPAQAALAPEPDTGGGPAAVSAITSPVESRTDWRQVGLGAVGGLALAAAGAVALGGPAARCAEPIRPDPRSDTTSEVLMLTDDRA